MQDTIRNISLLFFCLLTFLVRGQENLVLNGSFEEGFITPRQHIGSLRSFAKDWYHIPKEYLGEVVNSSCDLLFYLSRKDTIPDSLIVDGDLYGNIGGGFNSNGIHFIQEAMMGTFKNPLEVGKRYIFSFWEFSHPWELRGNHLKINSFGFYFATYADTLLDVETNEYPNAHHIDIMLPMEGKRKHTYEFVADSNYKYLYFGNFWATNKLSFVDNVYKSRSVRIDDVQLFEFTNKVTLPKDTIFCAAQNYTSFNKDTAAVQWYHNGIKKDSSYSYTFNATDGVHTLVAEVEGNKDTQIVTVSAIPRYDLTIINPCPYQLKEGSINAIFSHNNILYTFTNKDGVKEENGSFQLLNEKEIYLYYTNEYGCNSKDTILIEEKCKFKDTILCTPQDYTLFNYNDKKVQWYHNGVKKDSSNSYSFFVTEGIHSLVAEENGRKDTQIVAVSIKPSYEKVVNYPCPYQLKEGSIDVIFSNKNVLYSFMNKKGNRKDNLPFPLINENELYLFYTNEDNCSFKDTIIIEELCDTSLSEIHIPTAFTPNDDGNNDIFIINLPVGTKGALTIFNRWGEQLYQTNVMENSFKWDGTFVNSPCQTGTYLATIRVEVPTPSGQVVVIKNVTIEILR